MSTHSITFYSSACRLPEAKGTFFFFHFFFSLSHNNYRLTSGQKIDDEDDFWDARRQYLNACDGHKWR